MTVPVEINIHGTAGVACGINSLGAGVCGMMLPSKVLSGRDVAGIVRIIFSTPRHSTPKMTIEIPNARKKDRHIVKTPLLRLPCAAYRWLHTHFILIDKSFRDSRLRCRTQQI